MASKTSDTLAAISIDPAALKFRRGIEREALRVDSEGYLATTPHPGFLGSKLTHPTITTDFSESQLELITPVSDDIDSTLEQLTEIHRFVVQGLGDEILWNASMPCMLPEADQIPLARYGTSNVATLKTTYRNGLGQRYGRAMQTICAVHYNFSLPPALWQRLATAEGEKDSAGYRSKRYFDLMRNFRRLAWLPVYLFGSSPAVCRSFVRGREHGLEPFGDGSLYARHSTSLRSGNLGYQSDTQSGMVNVGYNSLDDYIGALAKAITTPHEAYRKLGLKRDDTYLQVNDCLLQSEAEFYTNIRAKCVPPSGANFLKALNQNGVEYLEVRLLDVNPYLPLGIDETEIRFLDMLLLHCLVTDSPTHDKALSQTVDKNMQSVVWNGRDPALALNDGGTDRSVEEWGIEVIRDLEAIANLMDSTMGGSAYADSLSIQRDKMRDAALTPSGRILGDMTAESIPYFRFAMNRALAHNEALRSEPLSAERQDYYRDLSAQSVARQAEIEANDEVDFDTYLARVNEEYQDLL